MNATFAMLNAESLRNLNTPDPNLRKDFDACFEQASKELYRLIEQSARRRVYTFVVMDYMTSLCKEERMPLTHIKPSTFFTGFWDKQTRTHSFEAFEGSQCVPMLDKLVEVFEPLGYKLTDISDDSKSMRRVLQVQIGDGE